MKKLLFVLLFILFLSSLYSLAASKVWTEIGCSTGNMNWSTAARWQCTSGCTTNNSCGNGDSPGYPSLSGDIATIGAWVTTVDVNVTVGDPSKTTTTAVAFTSGGTLWVPTTTTLTLVGQGIIVSSSVSNIKFHIEGTVQCTSAGSTVTYCPAFLYSASVAGQTNTVEICGNYSGGVCQGPTEAPDGYVTTPCPNYAHILGDGTAYTGPRSWTVTNAAPSLIWVLKCAEFRNVSFSSSTMYAFNVVDANGVKWIGSSSFSNGDSSCLNVIHRVRHLDIRSNTLPGGQFPIFVYGCTKPGSTATQPQMFEFITSDNAEKLWVFFVGSRFPFTIDHYAGGMQLSLVNNTQSFNVHHYAFIPYSATIYGSWGWAGINTGYANNVMDSFIFAPYSTAAQTAWLGEGVDEDSTSLPPSTGGGPNIIRNSFWDGWGAPQGANRYGHSDICSAYYLNNVAFNGAGRLAGPSWGYASKTFVTNVVSSGGTATISASQYFNVGDTVTVAGLTNSVLNGTYTITARVYGSSFSYANANTVSSQADSGTATDTALNYPGCVQFTGPQNSVGMVANFNDCDNSTSTSALGIPDCISVQNYYLYSPQVYTSDRSNDISGNIFTRIPSGVSQIGAMVYNTGAYTRQAYLNYDYNVYNGISGRSGNYKTPTGGNTYLAGPVSCKPGDTPNCTKWGGQAQRTQALPPGTTGCAGGTTQCGPFHLNAASTGIQVGDVLCDGVASATVIPCGIITAIGPDATCSTCAVTVGGQTLYKTDGSLGVGKSTAPVQSDTLTLYPKYTADTNPDYGSTNRGGRDLAVNPAYIDNTCTLAKWDIANGGPGSYANDAQSINANMVAMNGLDLSGNPTTFNPAYKIEKALTYLRRCWTPTNLMLKNLVKDPARCAQAGLGDSTGQCDPGALPVSVGAILGMTQ